MSLAASDEVARASPGSLVQRRGELQQLAGDAHSADL
jgi:hypothetical protein